jgi:hypothetical protein
MNDTILIGFSHLDSERVTNKQRALGIKGKNEFNVLVSYSHPPPPDSSLCEAGVSIWLSGFPAGSLGSLFPTADSKVSPESGQCNGVHHTWAK